MPNPRDKTNLYGNFFIYIIVYGGVPTIDKNDDDILHKMDPGECLLCKSKMREGTTEFVARVGEPIVVIKNISAFVCPNCNEAYYSIDTQRKIDRIMKAFHE